MAPERTLLFVHVLAATLWLGGGAAVAIVALRAERARDPGALVRFGRELEWFGSRILMPSAIVAFLSGVALTPMVASFGELWVLLALAAFGLSAALAVAFLGPRPGVIAELADEHGPRFPAVHARIKRHLLYNRIEVALLLLVLLDMVFKPSWE